MSAFLAENGKDYDGSMDATDVSALKAAAAERGIRLAPLPGYDIEHADDGLLYGKSRARPSKPASAVPNVS